MRLLTWILRLGSWPAIVAGTVALVQMLFFLRRGVTIRQAVKEAVKLFGGLFLLLNIGFLAATGSLPCSFTGRDRVELGIGVVVVLLWVLRDSTRGTAFEPAMKWLIKKSGYAKELLNAANPLEAAVAELDELFAAEREKNGSTFAKIRIRFLYHQRAVQLALAAINHADAKTLVDSAAAACHAAFSDQPVDEERCWGALAEYHGALAAVLCESQGLSAPQVIRR